MAKKGAAAAATSNEGGEVVAIRKKAPTDWTSLIKQVEADHWRRLRVTIRVREKLMAGKPAKLDAAEAMIKARGLEEVLEARLEKKLETADEAGKEAMAEEVKDEGLCEFHRREGKPGIWFPTNNLKACLKENWSVLGLRVEHRGSRGALAEGVFVYAVTEPGADPAERDWIFLGEKPDGVETAVSHTTGPKGPVSSIKRHEFLVRPSLTFEIAIARAIAEKLPDDGMAKTFVHAAEHGIGACRSQGFGRFNIESVEELADAQ